MMTKERSKEQTAMFCVDYHFGRIYAGTLIKNKNKNFYSHIHSCLIKIRKAFCLIKISNSEHADVSQEFVIF